MKEAEIQLHSKVKMSISAAKCGRWECGNIYYCVVAQTADWLLPAAAGLSVFRGGARNFWCSDSGLSFFRGGAAPSTLRCNSPREPIHWEPTRVEVTLIKVQ